MTTNNGGWSLVWKHSYVEVNPRTTDMVWHSDYYKPCLDLSGGSDGWCNVNRLSAKDTFDTLFSVSHD